MRSDADAFDRASIDVRHEDAVLLQEPCGQGRAVDPFDLHRGDAARDGWVEDGVEGEAGIVLQLGGPVMAEILEPSGLSLGSDCFVSVQGFVEAEQDSGGAGAELLELADVVVEPRIGRLKGPSLANCLLVDVEEPRTRGTEEPLVEAAGEHVAAQARGGIRDLADAVGAIDEGDHSVSARFGADGFSGEEGAVEEADAGEDEETGLLFQPFEDIAHQLGGGLGVGGNAGLGDLDAVPAFTLVKRRLDPGVILLGIEHYVPFFDVQAEDAGEEPLGGVGGDCDLFGVAAEELPDPLADALDRGVVIAEEVVAWSVVGMANTLRHGILDGAGGWAGSAVVEEEEVVFDFKRPADARPVVLILSRRNRVSVRLVGQFF